MSDHDWNQIELEPIGNEFCNNCHLCTCHTDDAKSRPCDP